MKANFEKWLEENILKRMASEAECDEIDYDLINQFAEDYAKEKAESCCVNYKQELLKEIEQLKAINKGLMRDLTAEKIQ